MKSLRPLTIIITLILTAFQARADYHPLTLTGQVKAKSTNIKLIGAKVTLVPPEGAGDKISTKARNYVKYGTSATNNYKETSDFTINIPKAVPGEYELIVQYRDYETQHLVIDLSDVGRREFKRDIGTIYLEKAQPVKTLDEVTVTASKVKFYNKGDTIVFNADAFNLAEGSMLDELIRQFPGVELRPGGAIYVNDRYVESLLLNGKDFFKGDNLVLLENLGAYTVKDVQVYEKESDKSRLAGRKVGGEKLVMDVNLKKEYIGGWIFNVEGGYGTEDRYMGRFFGVNFDATRRFTLYANSNNLNDNQVPGENTSWTPNTYGGGLMRHIESGFDYNIETGDEGRSFVSGNVKFKQDRVNRLSINDLVSFYPLGNMSGRSVSGRIDRNMKLGTAHKWAVNKDTYILNIEPAVTYSHSNERSLSRGFNLNTELPAEEVATEMDKVFAGGLGEVDRSQVINATFNRAFSKSHSFDLSAPVHFYFKVPKTTDLLHLYMKYSHRNDADDSNNGYMIGYGDPDMAGLVRRQRTSGRPNHNNSFLSELSYNCRLTDNWNATLTLSQQHDRKSRESAFYIAQAEADATGDFTLGHLDMLREVLDPLNCYNSVETSQRYTVNPTFIYDRKPLTVTLDLPFERTNRKLDYNRGGQLYPIKDNRWTLHNARLWFNINNYPLYISASYRFDQELPSLIRMIDIHDTTDPLFTALGNPDLSTAIKHQGEFMLNHSKRDKYMFSVHAHAILQTNAFIQSRLLDTSTGYTVTRWINSPTSIYHLSQSFRNTLTVGPKKISRYSQPYTSIRAGLRR